MGLEIRGKTQSLQWLNEMLSFFQAETITIPTDYRTRVLETKRLLDEDTSGLVSAMLDFSIDSALVNYRIETDNENLTEILNNWLGNINSELRGKIPTELEPLAKEYFRERWKSSSNILMRTFWNNVEGLQLPTTLFFVDGEDIKVEKPNKDEVVRLGEEQYLLRVSKDDRKDLKLPNKKNEEIFIQRPFESWGNRNPVPYLMKRGLFRNLKFFKLLNSKSEYIVGRALEYLLIMKKGTERMALEGRAEMVYDENDLKILSDDMKELLQNKKTEAGGPLYTTNFDTELEHFIPDYKKALNEEIYATLEKRLLAGLGMINIVEGVGATRRESMLNPKPFISETTRGIKDFKILLTDVIKTIIEKNVKSHPKWMNARIDISSTPIRAFMSDKFLALLRSVYDRGSLSKRTLVEIVGDLDFDLEVMRREDEKTKGYEEDLYPPVIQNIEGAMEPSEPQSTDPTSRQDPEQVPDDKKSVEKKNVKTANIVKGKCQKCEEVFELDASEVGSLETCPMCDELLDPVNESEVVFAKIEFEQAPFKTNKDLPPQVRSLPVGAKNIWRKTFNSVFEETKNEEQARMSAWRNVKIKYKKVDDKWVRKTKSEVEDSVKHIDNFDDAVELKKAEVLGKQEKLLDKLLKTGAEDEDI